jgi:F-type H+-transporting ATPase subunit delta
MAGKKRAQREAKQLFHFCLKNNSLDEGRVRKAVSQLTAADHRDGPAILGHFLRLVRLDRAQHMATIESARPLPAEFESAIRAGLSRSYGSDLTMTFTQRPALIGGVRIQVGCNVYDGSILARLGALERSF